MELALNLVWVCVAIAGILAQIVTLSRAASPDRPANQGRKIVAMGCTLVILFFVISMTDDLHDQEIVIEESKSSRFVAATSSFSAAPSARAVSAEILLVIFALSFVPALPAVRRFVEPSEILFTATVEHESLCGRAPPVSLA